MTKTLTLTDFLSWLRRDLRAGFGASVQEEYVVQLHVAERSDPSGPWLKRSSWEPIVQHSLQDARLKARELTACNRWGDLNRTPVVTVTGPDGAEVAWWS